MANEYEGRDLYVFGDTDLFGRGIEWHEYARAEGDGQYVPLFVLR